MSPSPIQFRIIDLQLVTVIIVAWLVLPKQLGAVGVGVAIFLSWLCIAWIRKRERGVSTALISSLVFCIVLITAGKTVAVSGAYNEPPEVRLIRLRLRQLSEKVEAHRKQTGQYPKSLGDLKTAESDFDIVHSFSRDLGVGLYYNVTPNGSVLLCLGRDKKFGGVGFDADFGVADRITYPLLHYIRDRQPFGGIWLVFSAIASGFLVGAIWRKTEIPSWSQISRRQMVSYGLAFFTLTMVAIGITVWLASFEIAVENSGH